MDFHNNNIIVLSSRGILAYNENLDSETNFKQIKNNLNSFLTKKQFLKWNKTYDSRFSFKDLSLYYSLCI